ncbi:Hsp20/alpha crystallin family protein [Candidatus Harpocratesius sp.]
MTDNNENTKIQSETASKDEFRPKYRITPKYGVYTEDDKVILQIAIPGVKKENIHMKALKDYFTLRAQRDENTVYMLDLDFGVKIEPEKTSSRYEEGLLRLEFKRFNPLEHAYKVPIQ